MSEVNPHKIPLHDPWDPIVMVHPDIIPFVVGMTHQTDRLSLISQFICSMHKFVPTTHIRFFDVRHEATSDPAGGRPTITTVLIEPLAPVKPSLRITEIPGVEECLAQTKPSCLHVHDQGVGWVLFSLVTESKVKSILILNHPQQNQVDLVLVQFFWDMFVNLDSILMAKDQDPLTGLFNRRSFDETISQILDSMSSSNKLNRTGGAGACLAVLDIDFFKRVNDNFGHAIGDEVLILFARQMERMFRYGDILYRFGGEEFLVILVDVDLIKARAALDRFRQSIEDHHFPQVNTVTVSIGFVMVNDLDFPPVLIEKADKALYYSKENGRNQVNGYEELVESGKMESSDHESEEVELWN